MFVVYYESLKRELKTYYSLRYFLMVNLSFSTRYESDFTFYMFILVLELEINAFFLLLSKHTTAWKGMELRR